MINNSKATSTPPAAVPSNPPLALLRWEGHMADDIAGTYGPEPMASLSATAQELILAGTRGTFRIPRAEIIKLGRGKMYPWFFSAVRIHHRIEGFPRDLQFKPLDAGWREVAAALRELGYPAA